MTSGARAALAAAVVLALALAPRLSNVGEALRGRPEVQPFDDLYHAKRIVFSVRQFPRVLDFDPDRGTRGEYCPWPPLYDLSMAAAARLAGARTPAAVLATVRWIPPLSTALFAAAVALVLARRLGAASGLVAGLAIGLHEPLLEASRLGALDHHFLEPPLALATALLAARVVSSPRWRDALALASVLAAGLLVQPAHVLSAGLAAAALLLLAREPAALARGATALGIGALAVALFRATRGAGYPDSAWFLGAPYVALLGGGAAALAIAAALERASVPAWRALALGVLAGGALALGAAGEKMLAGSRFFGGGDPWLAQIAEFQPLLSRMPLFWAVAYLGGAALLLPWSVRRALGEGATALTLALFAAAYTLLALARLRFAPLSIVFTAPLAALLLCRLLREGRHFGAAVAGMVAVCPLLTPALVQTIDPPPVVPRFVHPAIRAAQRLRGEPPGRLLGPWSYGHLFDVVGEKGAVLDNFGSSIGETEFAAASAALLERREERLAATCRENGIRYVAFADPFTGVPQVASSLGLPLAFWIRGSVSGAPVPTPLLRATVWWRAAVPGSPPLTRFEPLYADADPADAPPGWRSPALVVLRLR